MSNKLELPEWCILLDDLSREVEERDNKEEVRKPNCGRKVKREVARL